MAFPILAHGTMGPYDELIFAAVALVFVTLMAYSWWRNRDEMADEADENAAENATPADSVQAASDPAAPDRFRLE